MFRTFEHKKTQKEFNLCIEWCYKFKMKKLRKTFNFNPADLSTSLCFFSFPLGFDILVLNILLANTDLSREYCDLIYREYRIFSFFAPYSFGLFPNQATIF